MRILITGGPTREPIDEVRFISNRSSGRLAVAVAAAAAEAGHEATLLLGPSCAAPPAAVRTERFDTTAQLESLVHARFDACDVLIMACAVADYRPVEIAAGKLPRDARDRLTLALRPTPDLVAALAGRRRPDQRLVAFALEEPGTLETRAAEKLKRKGVDAIVANPLTTMDSDRIEPIVLTADGNRHAPGPMSKRDFAAWLIAWAQAL